MDNYKKSCYKTRGICSVVKIDRSIFNYITYGLNSESMLSCHVFDDIYRIIYNKVTGYFRCTK